MASLLSDPWIENSVVSALLYHKQRMPQERSSQVAQIISVRRNANVVVLSDGKFSVEAFYDNVNGTVRHESLVRLKDWGIVASGRSGVSRDEDAVCFHVPLLDIIGGQGMGIVGNPSPVNHSVEVRRVLDSWKFTSTSELLRHTKPPSGDVAKLLQDPSSHHRVLQQYFADSGYAVMATSSQTAETFSTARALAEQTDGQQLESPVSRKRPLQEQNFFPEKENTHNRKPPPPSFKPDRLQGGSESQEIHSSDNSSVVEDGMKMSIANMLIMEDDDKDEENGTLESPATMHRNDVPQPKDSAENNNTTNRFLQLWLKWTKQSPDTVVE